MPKKYLSRKETREFLQKVKASYGELEGVGAKENAVEYPLDERTKVIVVGNLEFIEKEGLIYPSLRNTTVLGKLPKVIVDSGAAPHILRGANVMRPGILEPIGSFGAQAVVSVVDEKYRSYLAVGLALKSSEELRAIRAGVVVKNLHHVGDKVWAFVRDVVHAPKFQKAPELQKL